MAKFKVGDLVVCVKASSNGYPGYVKDIYVVEELGNNNSIRISGCGEKFCDANRFELVTACGVTGQSASTATASADPRSDTEKWFDEKLAPAQQKKERVPDELDWEKHKQFMRSLQ